MDTQGSEGTLFLQQGTSTAGTRGIPGQIWGVKCVHSAFSSPGSVVEEAAQGASCEDSSLTSVSHQFPGVMKR